MHQLKVHHSIDTNTYSLQYYVHFCYLQKKRSLPSIKELSLALHSILSKHVGCFIESTNHLYPFDQRTSNTAIFRLSIDPAKSLIVYLMEKIDGN